MADIAKRTATQLYTALRDLLLQDPEGDHLVAAFEADPTGRSDELAARLTSLLNDPAQAEQLLAALGEDADERFVTMVTGGHVDQIVNVARLGVLNLTVKRTLYVFKNVAQLVVFLSAVLLVGLATVFLLWRAQQPARLSGAFNIAVATFGEVDDAGKLRVTGDSAKISQALANYLDSEYSTADFGLEVQVGHDRMPLIGEDRQAQKLAEAVNADLVIYGAVLSAGNTARVLPRFWVERNPNLEEITGQSSLEAPIGYEPTRLADSGYLTDHLRDNAAVLVLFTKVLVSLRADKLDAASHSIEQALQAAKEDFPGKEVLYMIGSVVAGRQRNYDLALERAETALALNPEYARAYLALGNVFYSRMVQESDWSREDLLDTAGEYYHSAIQATDAPPGAYISEKAYVSLGNVAVVQAQQRNDPALFQEAIDHYSQVVLRYEASSDDLYRADIQDLAATAYLGLGAAYQRKDDLERARQNYERCAETTSAPQMRQRCRELIQVVETSR